MQMGALVHNEFQLIIRELPLSKRPKPKSIESGALVKCIKAEGLSWEFNLKTGVKYRISNCQKGGVSIHGLSPNIFYDARRFEIIKDEPFLAINTAPIQKFGAINYEMVAA